MFRRLFYIGDTTANMKRKSGDISCENIWKQEIQTICCTDGRNQAYDTLHSAKIRIQLVLQIETGKPGGSMLLLPLHSLRRYT